MAATTRTDSLSLERSSATTQRLAYPPDRHLRAADAWAALIILLPFVWMISTSLKTADQLFTRPSISIPNPVVPQNYIDVWTSWLD